MVGVQHAGLLFPATALTDCFILDVVDDPNNVVAHRSLDRGRAELGADDRLGVAVHTRVQCLACGIKKAVVVEWVACGSEKGEVVARCGVLFFARLAAVNHVGDVPDYADQVVVLNLACDLLCIAGVIGELGPDANGVGKEGDDGGDKGQSQHSVLLCVG